MGAAELWGSGLEDTTLINRTQTTPFKDPFPQRWETTFSLTELISSFIQNLGKTKLEFKKELLFRYSDLVPTFCCLWEWLSLGLKLREHLSTKPGWWKFVERQDIRSSPDGSYHPMTRVYHNVDTPPEFSTPLLCSHNSTKWPFLSQTVKQ